MQKKKGISLIVLVITIIVMTILAAAVIISLENTGMVQHSKQATNKTNYAQELTRLEVMKNGILTDNLGKQITLEEYISELTNKGMIEGTPVTNIDGSKTVKMTSGAEVKLTQDGPRNILIEIAGYTNGNNNSGNNDNPEIEAGENQLNGSWVFNEEITYHNYIGYVEVNFTSNGVNYIGMNLWDETTTTPTGNTAYNYGIGYNTAAPSLGNYWAVNACSYSISDETEWLSNAYRTVNFGSSIQDVDPTFYTWFIANATKQ